MSAIRCRACGRSYDYEKQGLCPKCGAYNRPPRREWVDADGTVHDLDPRSAAVPPHRGKKVCYEQKTCFEDQTHPGGRVRSFHRDWSAVRDDARGLLDKLRHLGKKQRDGLIGVAVALLVLLPPFLNSCHIDRYYEPAPEPEWSVDTAEEPAIPIQPTDEYYLLGDRFTLLDHSVTVTGISIADDTVDVTVEGLPQEALLPWLTAEYRSGSSHGAYPVSFREEGDTTVFTYDRTQLDEDGAAAIVLQFDVLEDIDGDILCTGGIISVDLTECFT